MLQSSLQLNSRGEQLHFSTCQTIVTAGNLFIPLQKEIRTGQKSVRAQKYMEGKPAIQDVLLSTNFPDCYLNIFETAHQLMIFFCFVLFSKPFIKMDVLLWQW